MNVYPLVPGSFKWLVANEVRLNWRRFAGMLGQAGKVPPLAIAALAGVIAHVLAWPVVAALGPIADGTARSGADAWPLAGILLAVFCWMIAQSLFGAIRTLYDRGDLDLLLGSPLPAVRIFAAKSLSIAASTVGSIAVLVLPVANMGVVTGRPQWLAIYPVLVSLGLLATAVAVFTAISLFFLFGARRARLVMQLIGAAIGGGFVLIVQVVLLLPDAMQNTVTGVLAASMAPGSRLAAVIGIPVAATLGDMSANFVMLVLAVACFGGAVFLLSEPFAKASLAASGQGAVQVQLCSRRRKGFKSRPGPALRRKEWRLLMRDPGLFAQISLQIIYTLPMVLVLVKSNTVPMVVAIVPSIVVIVAQVAASLAWITVSGEDAPELIATAPVNAAAVDASKFSAIAIPIAGLLAIPVAALALVSIRAAVITAGLAIGASLSTALLNIWHPMPGNRRGMLRRHSQSKLMALIEHIIAMMWAAAAVLAFVAGGLSVMPIVVACAILMLAVPGSKVRILAIAPRLRRVGHPPLAATQV